MTAFRESVFAVVKKIPKGSVLTYKEVAKRVGSPGAYRAVGNILPNNYDLSIPWHRVGLTDGKAGGYNRGGDKKIRILQKEGVKI